jgi:hypothetical protein
MGFAVCTPECLKLWAKIRFFKLQIHPAMVDKFGCFGNQEKWGMVHLSKITTF